MYKNIGQKMEILAKIIAWIGIAGSVVLGILYITSSAESWGLFATDVALGILIIIGGSLISWISSWTLYGFGVLITKVSEIAANTAKKESDT